jgi:hypothetical protein
MTVGDKLDVMTAEFSLFAYQELAPTLGDITTCRMVLPVIGTDLLLHGKPQDRAARNRLQGPWLARTAIKWLQSKVEVRNAPGVVPQGALVTRKASGQATKALLGSLSFSTDGLGVAQGNPLSMIQASESEADAEMIGQWFDANWETLNSGDEGRAWLLSKLQGVAADRPASHVYALLLHHLFKDRVDALDEEQHRQVRDGHPQHRQVWKKLFKFQRDGVVGAIDKLDPLRRLHHGRQRRPGQDLRSAGCHQVPRAAQRPSAGAVPKRLRDNWTIYRSTTVEHVLAS